VVAENTRVGALGLEMDDEAPDLSIWSLLQLQEFMVANMATISEEAVVPEFPYKDYTRALKHWNLDVLVDYLMQLDEENVASVIDPTCVISKKNNMSVYPTTNSRKLLKYTFKYFSLLMKLYLMMIFL